MDREFLFDLGVSAIITTLRGLKAGKRKIQLRSVFKKINTMIAGVYGDDKDFQQVWGVEGEDDEE